MSATEAQDSNDLNPVVNVGDLRRLLDGRADDVPVRIHFGWDLDIVESGFDDKDGAVLLFADPDSGVSTVSTEWLNKAKDCVEENATLERLVSILIGELPAEERKMHMWALRRRAAGLTCTAEDYAATHPSDDGAEGSG